LIGEESRLQRGTHERSCVCVLEFGGGARGGGIGEYIPT
jgi:hypothetical protein